MYQNVYVLPAVRIPTLERGVFSIRCGYYNILVNKHWPLIFSIAGRNKVYASSWLLVCAILLVHYMGFQQSASALYKYFHRHILVMPQPSSASRASLRSEMFLHSQQTIIRVSRDVISLNRRVQNHRVVMIRYSSKYVWALFIYS